MKPSPLPHFFKSHMCCIVSAPGRALLEPQVTMRHCRMSCAALSYFYGCRDYVLGSYEQSFLKLAQE